jgi:uncharacterized protein (UPF0333 family)
MGKKMNKKAQVGMEYMTLVVFITAIILPLILLYHTQYEGTNEQIRGNQADQIARKVLDAAESVYYLGEPSKTTVKVYIPEMIESINITDNEIVFYMRTRQGIDEVVRYSPIKINGSIGPSHGIKYIKVESKGSVVQITSN